MTKQENYPREKCECFKCSDGKCSGKTCAVGDVQVRRTDQDTSGQMPVSRCKCSGAKCSGDKYSQRLLYAVSSCIRRWRCRVLIVTSLILNMTRRSPLIFYVFAILNIL